MVMQSTVEAVKVLIPINRTPIWVVKHDNKFPIAIPVLCLLTSYPQNEIRGAHLCLLHDIYCYIHSYTAAVYIYVTTYIMYVAICDASSYFIHV